MVTYNIPVAAGAAAEGDSQHGGTLLGVVRHVTRLVYRSWNDGGGMCNYCSHTCYSCIP